MCALVLSIDFLKSSSGLHTLLPNQTISIGQTLISPNQDFEMGFFSPGKSQNSFLGIWYKNTPHVVVWVANRNNLISDSDSHAGVTFSICGNGTLVISKPESIIWSANPPGAASNPILQLQDTGNLVIVNETVEEGSSKRYIWQSFDYPTDTLLTGIKYVDDIDAGVVKYLTSWRNGDDPSTGDFVARIENQGLPELVIYRGKTKIFRNGKWNGLYFGGFPRVPSEFFKIKQEFRGERMISLTTDHPGGSMLRRTTLDSSGKYNIYTMNARKDKWNLVHSSRGDKCDEYGVCGPNSICSFHSPIRCMCLKGFAPKFQREWDLQDWSGGCTRITPLNCKNGDGFQEVRGVKFPDMLEFSLNISMSLDECKAECLKSCNCTEISSIPETFLGQILSKTSMFAYQFQK